MGSIRTCLVCGKEIPFGEDCLRIESGFFSESRDTFEIENVEGYAHRHCLPIEPTL